MNWLKSKLREWLGIESDRANDLAFVNSLAAQVVALSQQAHTVDAQKQNQIAKSSAKAAKPYCTASEIRNKLERSSEEKA